MPKSQIQQDKQLFLDPNSTLPKTYFELIEKVGSSGKYQRTLFLVFILVYFVNGTVMLSTSFMFMNSRYACQQQGLLTQNCVKTVCQINDSSYRERYFKKNKEDIQSAATDYGPFMCNDEFQLDMIKGSPYFGSLLGFIVFSYLSDNYGRRKTMCLSLGLAALGSIIVAIGYNITMVAIGVMMSGAGINVSAGIVFYFLGQTVQNFKRQKYSILVQSAYTTGAISLTGMYYFVGNWRVISIILTTIPAVVVFFIFLMYVEETPLFLLKGQNKEALKALNRIGYINYKIRDILTEEDIENVKMEQLSNESFSKANVSPLDLFKFSSLRKTTIVSCLMCYIVISMYYGPTLIIDTIGFNTYATSIAIQISELIGFVPLYYFIDKVNRKTTGFCLFAVTVVSSLIVALIQKPKNCDLCLQSIIEVVVIFIFRFCIAIQFAMFLIYAVQLFPTRVVGLGNGALNVFGTIASTISPLILGYLKRAQFNLMLFFFILGVIGCASTQLLQETLGKPLKVEIDEIAFAKNKKKSQYISQFKGGSQFLSSKKYI